MTRSTLTLAAVSVVAAIACAPGGAAATAATTPTALAATATATPTSASPTATPPSLVIIVMENLSYDELQARIPADRAYLDAFAAGGLRFTDYREGSSRGPSLADYLQMVAGSSCGKTDDSVVAADPVITAAGCTTTLWDQLQAAGIGWGVYGEGMPSPCSSAVTQDSASTGGPYLMRHVPAPMFASVFNASSCAEHVLPLSSLDPANPPAVTFITPNACNDDHGSGGGQWVNCIQHSDALLQRGDAWLASHVPPLLASGAQVFITFDESGTLYAALQGPGVTPGATDATAYTHYSLLAAIEDRYGLPRLLNASGATPLPLP